MRIEQRLIEVGHGRLLSLIIEPDAKLARRVGRCPARVER
jgi:hypothetical protein